MMLRCINVKHVMLEDLEGMLTTDCSGETEFALHMSTSLIFKAYNFTLNYLSHLLVTHIIVIFSV